MSTRGAVAALGMIERVVGGCGEAFEVIVSVEKDSQLMKVFTPCV